MRTAKIWLACGAIGVVPLACGSEDSNKTAREAGGGEGGAMAEAGEPSVSGAGPRAGGGGMSAQPEGGAGGLPIISGSGGEVIEGGAGAGPGPLSVVVEAKYPNHGAFWLDYVKNDGSDVVQASDVACDPVMDGPRYNACVHGGEIRRVSLVGAPNCDGIVGTDALDAFDWVCQEQPRVELVSTGLKSGKHLSDLLDFNANTWKQNSVTVQRDGQVLAQTEPTMWWANPVTRLTGASCTADIGEEHAIFLLDATSSNSNCTGKTGKIALSTVPGEVVTDFRFTGRGAFNWFEGDYTLQNQYSGLNPGPSGFHVVRNVSYTASSPGTGFATAISMQGTRAGIVRDIETTGGRTIVGALSAVGLELRNVSSTGARADAIVLTACTDCSVVNATLTNTGNRAILVQQPSPRLLLKDVIAEDNGGGAISLSQVSAGRVENVKIARASATGLGAVLTSATVFKSIVVDGAVGAGVSVDQGDDNRLVDIRVGNAGSNGVMLGGNRTVLQHARISCGKGLGTTGSGVTIPTNTFYSRVQDVTVASCRYGIDMNGSANVVQAVTVAATEDVGFRNASYASLIEDGVALDASYGLYYLSNVFGPTRLRSFAASHNQIASVYANNSTLDIGEKLIVGASGVNGMGADCDTASTTGLDDACGSHPAMLTTGASVLGAIVGLVSDATNPQGAAGSSPFGEITSFTTFAADTRRFIRAGAGFPDYSARGPCSGAQTCAILDLALKSTDTLLRNRNAPSTGDDVTSHAWFVSNNVPASQAACDARVPGSVFVAGAPNRCDSVFLKHAWELIDDGAGDDDGFCESGETCEVARNLGGYQGHGDLVSAGTFTAGILSGIQLVQRENNGY